MGHLSIVLAVAALGSSILLLVRIQERVLPGVAVAVSAVEVLRNLHVLQLGMSKIPLSLLLGAGLAVCGVMLILRQVGKYEVAAATVVTMVGAIQVLFGLRLI
jgi:hypothetical protein